MPRAVKREREEDESAIPTLAALKEYPQSELAHMCMDATKKAIAATERAAEFERRVTELSTANAASIAIITAQGAALKNTEKELKKAEKELTDCRKSLADAEKKNKQSAIALALMEHADEPLKVLWDVLNGEGYKGPSAAMSVINDPRCGLRVREKHELNSIPALANRHIVASPLSLAVHASRIDVLRAVVQTLRSAGLDVVKALNESKVVEGACSANDYSTNLLSYVLSLGASPNVGIPLVLAAISDNADAIKSLLASGADKDRGVKSALHYAVIGGHITAVKALIDANAKVDVKCDDGKTPIDYARTGGNAAILAILETARKK